MKEQNVRLIPRYALDKWLSPNIVRAYKSIHEDNGSRYNPCFTWTVGTHTTAVDGVRLENGQTETGRGFYAFLDRDNAFHPLYKAVMVYMEPRHVIYGGYGHWGERFICCCQLKIISLRGLRK